MSDSASDEIAIRELIANWMSASKAGNTDAVLNLMTEDVVFLVPGREPFGKDFFRQASEQMRNVSIEGESTIEEVSVHSDWAWCRTRLAITITPPGGDAIRRSGHTLTIFQKQLSGAWLLARDASLLTNESPAAAGTW